jgi:hypothetical protein
MLEDLIRRKEKEFEKKGHIEFSDQEIDSLSKEDAYKIEKHFHGSALMRLPQFECQFFQWLRETDQSVWEDLWDDEDDPYYISIDFLHHFINDGNGFPICDLVDEDNYWFTGRHIKPKGLEKFHKIDQKIQDNKPLSVQEALLCEILKSSIDIWHFCHRYKVSIQKAKQEVKSMHEGDLLVHLTSREDLVKYLDI